MGQLRCYLAIVSDVQNISTSATQTVPAELFVRTCRDTVGHILASPSVMNPTTAHVAGRSAQQPPTTRDNTTNMKWRPHIGCTCEALHGGIFYVTCQHIRPHDSFGLSMAVGGGLVANFSKS